MNDLPLSLAGGGAGQLGILGSVLLGISMGLTACTVTCLPFMGSWVMGRGRGRSEAVRDVWIFLAGRIVAYGTLGLLAGALGTVLGAWLAGGLGHLAIGAASCIAGLWLLLSLLRADAPAPSPAVAVAVVAPARARATTAAGDAGVSAPAGCRARRWAGRAPPFLLGAALSLTPCAPLGWLLTVCALSGNATAGFAHGLAFGLGAAVTPLLLLVPLFGELGARVLDGREWLADWLSGAAGFVLIALGVKRLLLGLA